MEKKEETKRKIRRTRLISLAWPTRPSKSSRILHKTRVPPKSRNLSLFREHGLQWAHVHDHEKTHLGTLRRRIYIWKRSKSQRSKSRMHDPWIWRTTDQDVFGDSIGGKDTHVCSTLTNDSRSKSVSMVDKENIQGLQQTFTGRRTAAWNEPNGRGCWATVTSSSWSWQIMMH